MTDSQAALLESIPGGLILLDSGGRCAYLNAEAAALVGRSREDLLGKEGLTFFGGAPLGLGNPEVARALRERVPVEFEEYLEDVVRWVEFRVAPAPGEGVVVSLRDVSDRKLAELDLRLNREALRMSEQRFVRFMENLPGLAWMKDLQGRYTYANAAAARAFRVELEAIHGRRDEDLFPPETAAQFRANDRQALESGGLQLVETLEHDDGVLHHSLVSKFPVTDPDGSVIGVGGMAIDITERVRMEEALRTADRRKDEFLAMLAHELRNPLAPIVAAVEILRLRCGEDPLVRRQREVVERQIHQMRRLVDDLLDVSRITRGKIALQVGPVDLREVLLEAVEMSRPLFDKRGHALEIALPAESMPAHGDAVRLCQAFTNLLINAANYTPPGGQVRLSAVLEEDAGRISVRDNGMGMSPKTIARAFELFAQGERGLERSPAGLGLGLTLVRELVERHGGTVTAHSDGIGQGSEFIVHLPLEQPSAGA